MRDLLNRFDLTLVTVVGSGNSVARQVAIKLVSRLAARGMPEYQDLIQDYEPETSGANCPNSFPIIRRSSHVQGRTRFTNDATRMTAF